MKYRYIKLMGSIVWGIKDLTKERFVSSVAAGDTIIDLEEMKVFNPEENAWEDIEGDK